MPGDPADTLKEVRLGQSVTSDALTRRQSWVTCIIEERLSRIGRKAAGEKRRGSGTSRSTLRSLRGTLFQRGTSRTLLSWTKSLSPVPGKAVRLKGDGYDHSHVDRGNCARPDRDAGLCRLPTGDQDSRAGARRWRR